MTDEHHESGARASRPQETGARASRPQISARASDSPQGERRVVRPQRSDDAGETPALQDKRPEHRDWYSRGYLPHFDVPDLIQSITFRLGDALPAAVIKAIEQEYRLKGKRDDPEKYERFQEYLDAGHGSCALRDLRVAHMVEGALLYFDAQRYRLLEWVVMPNHVHALIETVEGHRIGNVLHSWKSFTSKEANRILGRSGTFWQADFFDRYIRNEKHYNAVVNYIRDNPVMAGLAQRREDWPYGSAARAAERP
jgi:REP element-mobilizing transposase RayT